MKVCNICKVEKELSEFAIRKEGIHRNDCKQCRILYLREYRKGNKDNPYKLEIKTTKVCRVCHEEKPIDGFVKSKRICKPCQKEYDKKRYLENKDLFLIKSKNRYDENKEEIKKRTGEYSKNNRDKINKRANKYREEVLKKDPLWVIKNRISNNVRSILKSKGISKKFNLRKSWLDIIGCSVSDFVIHIESQFTEGMNWENRNLWHIDHIVPQSFAENIEEVLMLNHYSNLRPMWSRENIQKSNLIDESNDLYIKIVGIRGDITS